jgi:cytoskeletal protein RodZ
MGEYKSKKKENLPGTLVAIYGALILANIVVWSLLVVYFFK